MKKIWTMTYESIPGDGEKKVTFKSFDEARRTIKEMISQVGVWHYTKAMRDGANIPYREAMAGFVEKYVSQNEFFRRGDALPSDDISDYPCDAERKNDSDTYIDDDLYDESDEPEDFEITICEDTIMLKCFGEDDLSLRTNMVFMDDEEEFYEFKYFASSAPEDKLRELAIELELTLNQPWGTSAYPVLILQTLQNSSEHLSQKEIAKKSAIERKAVGRNMALLKEIGYDIRHDGKGYYIPKATSALEQNDFQAIVESIRCNDALNDDRKRELIDKLFEL